MQETLARFLGQEDPMAIHFRMLAWRIPMDKGNWCTTVHGVTKSQTQLSDQGHTHTHTALCSALGQATSTKKLTPWCRHWRAVGKHMSKASLTYLTSPHHSPGMDYSWCLSGEWHREPGLGAYLVQSHPASKKYKWDLNSFLCGS